MTIVAVSAPTLRATEVLLLSLAADGLNNQQIGAATGAEPRAVQHAMSYLIHTLDVDSRPQAVALAYRKGWLTRVPTRRAFAALTDRQTEIVQMVVDGMGQVQIARKLEVGSRTVYDHLERIFARTGARNRSQLIRIAVDTGLAVVRSEP